MYEVPGYTIKDQIYESENSLVYRGIRDQDELPVILKTLKQDYPSVLELQRYRREFELTRDMNIPGVVKVYGQEKVGNTPVIILEDFGGESLRILLGRRKFPLAILLELSIRIVQILGEIHERRIIHKDINPSNIVYEPQSDRVKIIDFGISTRLSREFPVIENPEHLEGTLAYMAPEQTGRMNRALDYRADFYALGATLYEIFVGSPPFEAGDAMELVHAHLAREPLSPASANPKIPEDLSLVILKLLAKRSEERYQTIQGLLADLEYIKAELVSSDVSGAAPGEKTKTFTAGAYDVPERFQLPEILYGRDEELRLLLRAAERVADGASRAIYVAGYSGVGKSALIAELKTLTARRGYFIAGKFDQYHRDVPYGGVQIAFRDLIRQLLTENAARLEQWKFKIEKAVAPNGAVLTEYIPELEVVLGKQASAPELDPSAARNRFRIVLRKFIQTFQQAEHPLTVFLDDLQWADQASLGFIRRISGEGRHLLFIGAYRENEVGPAHPVSGLIEDASKAGVLEHKITLQELGPNEIGAYIADITHRDINDVAQLAELVRRKTNGNPFFMGEFFKKLHREKLLEFEPERGAWSWELQKLQEQNISDNVVELISARIGNLPEAARTALMEASCLGNTFELATLALIHEKSPAETAGDLWPALDLSMILPRKLGRDEKQFVYKFAHDRIAEAAYSLVPEDQKYGLHLKVGRLLLEYSSEEERNRNIFAIVDHLNLGMLSEEEENPGALVELNLKAGNKAQTSTAYLAALNYYRTGMKLLGSEGWEQDYKRRLALSVKALEAAYFLADEEELAALSSEILLKARSHLDSLRVFEIQIQNEQRRNNPTAAIDTALKVLRRLGIKLPAKPGMLHIVLELLKLKFALLGKSNESLAGLPGMMAPGVKAAMGILNAVAVSSYLVSPELFPILMFRMIRLTIKNGNMAKTPYAYVAYALINTGVLGNIKEGERFGKLALDLLEKPGYEKNTARVRYVYYYLVHHWTRPLKECIQPLFHVYEYGLNTGDWEFSCYGACGYSFISFICGAELKVLNRKMLDFRNVMEGLEQPLTLNYINIWRQSALILIGEETKPEGVDYSLLCGAAYDELAMQPFHEEVGDTNVIFNQYFNNLMLACLFQEYEQGVGYAERLEELVEAVPGYPTLPHYYFYDSICRLALIPELEPARARRFMKKVKANRKKIDNWAAYEPMNQAHRSHLLGAETARINGDLEEARRLYELSVTLARKQDLPNDEALAWELAGRFYLKHSLIDFAQVSLKNARYAYERWGAIGKARQVELQYPEFFTSDTGFMELEHLQAEDKSEDSVTSGTRLGTRGGNKVNQSLDLVTIIKASQAISGEIVLDSLLRSMMRLLIENAGAQKGYFLLEKSGVLSLEAEAVTGAGPNLLESGTSRSIHDESLLPLAILTYTQRTGDVLVLPNAHIEGDFTDSEYVRENQTASVICVPLRKQGRVSGLLYMENNLTTGAFTRGHVKLLEILTAQIELSIENAQLYANLEEQVARRTEELEVALVDVNSLKNQQDGDYFLTARLLDPLSENSATDKRITCDVLLKQFKEFRFKQWRSEIGGDMCSCQDILLGGRTYTLFLSADAMGKSMQGAGGSLVLLTALQALLEKLKTSPARSLHTPDSWLRNVYYELFAIFATFKGSMQVSLILGLADGEERRLYYFNGEHPAPVLFRNGRAVYVEPRGRTYMLGALEEDPPLFMETLDLEMGDMLFLGSDGKDDLILGLDGEGNRLISDDHQLFLTCVEEAEGDLAQIMNGLLKRGDFMDDFSLLRLFVNSL